MDPTAPTPTNRASLFRRRTPLAFGFLLATVASALAAAPGIARVFDVPAGAARETLKRFASQAEVEIVFPSENTLAVRTNAVSGRLTPEAAIQALLTGTGLAATRDPKTGAFSVRPDPAVSDRRRAEANPDAEPAPGDARAARRTPTGDDVAAAAGARRNGAIVELDPFTVQGFRSSIGDSIEAKRNSGQVMDSITAEQVGQFGDQDVGEAIQRISGVALTRNNGEGQFVSIRGMSPDFTRVEVDGRSTFMTSDQSDPGRAVLLSVFSSDLYKSIEVIKSPTAADTEGGAGGVVRLKTPDPLASGRLRWGFKARVMDAELRDREEPNFSAYYSNTFADRRIGVLVAATYDMRDRRLDKVQMGDPVWQRVNTSNPALAGGWYPARLRLESRRGDVPKLNVNAKLQFQMTPELQVYANTVVTREKRTEEKSRIQVEFSNGTFVTGALDPATMTLTSGQFTGQQVNYNDFTRDTRVDTTGATGGIIWKQDRWRVEAKLSTSEGKEDFDEYQVQARIARDGAGGYELGDDPRTPRLFTASVALEPARIALRALNDNKRITVVGEDEFQVDAVRTLRGGLLTSVHGGIRMAETKFKRRQGGPPSANVAGLTFANGRSPFVLDGSFGFGRGGGDFLTRWPEVDAKEMYFRHAPSGGVDFDSPNHYVTQERNDALYGMVKFNRRLGEALATGNLGLRWVRTEYAGDGRRTVTTATRTYVLDNPPALESSYDEPLPALNVVLQPRPDSRVLVRGAITRAMTRPTVSQISPVEQIDAINGTIVSGNPGLAPYRAWQYDLGLEYYFGGRNEGLVSVSGFAKEVENFIVPDVVTRNRAYPEQGVAGQDFTIRTFRNGGGATIRGAEINFQTPFTFLPGFLRHFGTSFNYTYTNSEFTDANGLTFTFPGASKNTYNVMLYFERGRFSTRLAFNSRDDYLDTPSRAADGTNAIYGQGKGRLDLSVRYRFKNGLRLTLDALNLTREQSYLYYDIPQRYQNFEFEGRILSAGVGFDF